ncbi:MAG: hypothetical protein AB8B51_08125 [Sedimentitalea sp.]
MEQSLGLSDLSSIERDVYYAANTLGERSDVISSEDLQQHPLVEQMSKPTYFRALKKLVSLGYLSHAVGTKTGKYTILTAPVS